VLAQEETDRRKVADKLLSEAAHKPALPKLKSDDVPERREEVARLVEEFDRCSRESTDA
jgi:hypothetical protein